MRSWWEPVVTRVPVHVSVTYQPSVVPSNLAEHIEQGEDCMHAVEKVQRNGKIENCGPYTEAERLLFQTVVVLWSAAEGGKDPQLKRDKQVMILFICGQTEENGPSLSIREIQTRVYAVCCYTATYLNFM